MKHFLIVVIVALLALAVLLFLFNPDLLEAIWLWVIGLIGVIISAIKRAVEWFYELFQSNKELQPKAKGAKTTATSVDERTTTEPDNLPQTNQPQQPGTELSFSLEQLEKRLHVSENEDDFQGTTLTVLRYLDDGETTLGLLFVNNQYFSYTLEDTYREVKVKGKTRIPKGIYQLDFNRYDTPLTLKYRETRPWFTYHLHVKDVPGFEGIYIHSGSTHEHTDGCLLVARSIYDDQQKSSIFNSKATFEELYKQLKVGLDNGEQIRIQYYDEDFMSYSMLKNKAS